jgi:glutamate/tyrosine decarboxylase-like PLP-dependent enzyme
MYHNPLHINTFHGVRQMESELIQMTGHLYNHPNVFGVATNGGTDSIFQALTAYRD